MSWRMWIGPNEYIMPGRAPKVTVAWKTYLALAVVNVVFWGVVVWLVARACD